MCRVKSGYRHEFSQGYTHNKLFLLYRTSYYLDLLNQSTSDGSTTSVCETHASTSHTQAARLTGKNVVPPGRLWMHGIRSRQGKALASATSQDPPVGKPIPHFKYTSQVRVVDPAHRPCPC